VTCSIEWLIRCFFEKGGIARTGPAGHTKPLVLTYLFLHTFRQETVTVGTGHRDALPTMCIGRPNGAINAAELSREKALSACLSIRQAVGGNTLRNMSLDTGYNSLH
jgi:hypothetical protein